MLHYDGTPITARFITREIAEKARLFNVTPLRKVARDDAELRGADMRPKMTYLAKPKLHHPRPAEERARATRAATTKAPISTLCAGCGHDSISAAIIQAFFELDIAPHRVAKLSGIGCSSKTPTYFLGNSHGFNSVHGRMPSVLTGAAARQPRPHLSRRVRRRRFGVDRPRPVRARACGAASTWSTSSRTTASTASPRASSRRPPTRARKAKRGAVNSDEPIDLVHARAAAGRDVRRARLLRRQGAARAADQGGGRCTRAPRSSTSSRPCVAFNNHPGSTKSYDYVREHNEAVNRLDFMLPREPITADVRRPAACRNVVLHDGGTLRLRKLHADYDPHEQGRAR